MSIPTSEPTLTAREQANAEAARRMCEAEPVLVDLRPAGEVVPGMTARHDPHVGRAAARGGSTTAASAGHSSPA